MRALVSFVVLLLVFPAIARPKSTFIEIKTMPGSVKGLAAVVQKEKPSDFRTQALWQLETKLRENGEELTDPDAIDALVDELLKRVFDDMALPTDIYMWEGDEAPRGEVLIRDPVLLLPGRTSSGFARRYEVTPMGLRIDRGYRNTSTTVKVAVAKSAAEWFAHVESKGWGVAVHPIHVTDGVARVVLQFLSRGGTAPPSARHERPIWVAFFRQDAAGGPWQPLVFDGAKARLARDQESTLLPFDPKTKLTDAMKRHVLALRFDELKLINPNRSTLHETEARWTSLNGLSGSVVDPRTAGWLDVYRTSDEPLVRAAATLKVASLGGSVSPDELVDVLVTVKQARVQAEALLALQQQLDGSAEAVSVEDQSALAKLGGGDDVKVFQTVARVKSAKATKLFKKGAAGWQPVVPKQ